MAGTSPSAPNLISSSARSIASLTGCLLFECRCGCDDTDDTDPIRAIPKTALTTSGRYARGLASHAANGGIPPYAVRQKETPRVELPEPRGDHGSGDRRHAAVAADRRR